LDVFSISQTTNKVVNVAEMYNSEILSHINRWGWPYGHDDWIRGIDALTHFLEVRPCEFAYQLFEFIDSPSLPATWTETFCSNQYELPGLTVIPNPNNGNFYINSHDEDMSGKLLILNTNGSVIYRENNFFLNRHERQLFSFPELKNGVYIASYIGQSDIKNMKFIVSK